jgi:hypothetical protein
MSPFLNMNKLIAKFTGALVIVLLVAVATTTSGCDKDIVCKAVITVKDASGSPVVGAEVKLTSGDVELIASTDGSGTANFETNLPMILDIYVNGGVTGRVARFEDDKTDNVTIQL